VIKEPNKDHVFGVLVGTISSLFGMVIGFLFFIFIFPGKELVFCPEVRLYSQDFLERAADELETLPENSASARLVGDYKTARDEMRKCAN
jgi:hypothetical protein